MIGYQFNLLKTTRQHFLTIINALPAEKLTVIPSGFRNNILWNAGHVMATQQLLFYGRTGKPYRVPGDFIELFRKGTAPEQEYPSETITFIREHLLTTVDWAAMDCQNGLFNAYESYTTSFGVELRTFEEALQFLNVHEGLHLGYVMAMRKGV